MKNFLKKNLDLILVTLILLALIIINIRPEKIIMGLDNASPYFNPFEILSRIKDTSAVIYGGITFQLPLLETLNRVGVGPELISNIYVFANLFLGTIGIALLVKRQFKNTYITVLGTMIFLSNLFVFWIFAHPNFLFIAAFGSIPVLIYLLTSEQIKWYHWILITIFSISFLTTTLNIVAFALYTISISGIILVLGRNNKTTFKRLLFWILALILVWVGTIQAIMYVNQDKTFFPVRIYEYTQELLDNDSVNSSTQGIIASEKTNTLTRTMSYALGWMELHDSNNLPIFEYYATYRENTVYILLGLIPFLLALPAIFIKQNKITLLLTICLIFFTFVCSRYGISLIEKIPYLSDSLRWASSKLWPLYIFPLIFLATTTIQEIFNNSSKIVKYLFFLFLTTSLFVYSYPVLKGNLLSAQTLVNIPTNYFELPENSKILILPHAQKLYMRQYDWGYYGSDFLTYISNSEIIDGANVFEYATEYEDILDKGEIPENTHYVLYDNSAENNLTKELMEKSQKLVEGLTVINSNEYFTIYGN